MIRIARGDMSMWEEVGTHATDKQIQIESTLGVVMNSRGTIG